MIEVWLGILFGEIENSMNLDFRISKLLKIFLKGNRKYDSSIFLVFISYNISW